MDDLDNILRFFPAAIPFNDVSLRDVICSRVSLDRRRVATWPDSARWRDAIRYDLAVKPTQGEVRTSPNMCFPVVA